jgi:hypothetical protein
MVTRSHNTKFESGWKKKPNKRSAAKDFMRNSLE